jgi:hypothetical protein
VRAKAVFGEPCNRCGLCCSLGPCSTAQALLHLDVDSGRCPVLKPDLLGGFVCGLVEAAPSPRVREAVSIAIGSGVGCDMTYDDADVVARPRVFHRLLEGARQARRNASPDAEVVLRRWRLAPP